MMACNFATEKYSFTIRRIARHLYLNGEYVKNISLIEGGSGISLFYYYCSRILNDEHYTNCANDLLDVVCSSLSESLGAHYETGISGIGAFMAHLGYHDFVDFDEGDVFACIDEKLLRHLQCICIEDQHFSRIIGSAAYYNICDPGDDTGELSDILRKNRQLVSKILSHRWKNINHVGIDVMKEIMVKDRIDKDILVEPSLVPFIYQLLIRNPDDHSLNELLNDIAILQQKGISGLEEAGSPSLRNKSYYVYWAHLALLNYAQLFFVTHTNGEERIAEDLLLKIRICLEKMGDDTKGCATADNSIFYGNLRIILICNSMYRYTLDEFYLNRRELFLKKYLGGAKGVIAGIPAGSFKVNNFSLEKGMAGIGLVLLSCIHNRYLAWEELVFHHDLPAQHATW